MAFINIANENGVTTEVVVFPKVFEKAKALIDKDSLVIIKGRLDSKNDRPVILAEEVKSMKSIPQIPSNWN